MRLLAFLLILVLVGCAHANVAPMVGLDAVELDSFDLEQMELWFRIRNVIGEARADDVEQCNVIGVGAKPCGGPSTYLSYSETNVQFDTLNALVVDYNVLSEERNRRIGVDSDCRFMSPPEPSLVDGRCVWRDPNEEVIRRLNGFDE